MKKTDERKLRYLLFMSHKHPLPGNYKYSDDGEMQCCECGCDFVKDTPDELEIKIEMWNLNESIRMGLLSAGFTLGGFSA